MTSTGGRTVLVLAGLLWISGAPAGTVWTDSPIARLEALALIESLNAEILASSSATLTLERWCRDHALAEPPLIVARRLDTEVQEPSAAIRQDLQVSAQQKLRYRRVELRCGDHVLSVAENWYVPSRLSASINRLLDTTQTPFGKAVQSLHPHRETMGAQLLWLPLAKDWDVRASAAGPEMNANGPLVLPQALFEQRAVLYTPPHRAIAEVHEVYQRDVLAFPQPQLPPP